MSFRLFGVNVEIQMSFWITSVILGLGSLSDPQMPRGAIAIWVLVVFVSVLVHELGHALAVMRHGIEPQITLYAMGGLTRYQPVVPLRRRDQVLISLAGPFAGFAVGAVTLAVLRLFPHAFAGASTLRRFAVDSLLWVNFGWGIINLMPVLPFDGGHVLEQTLGPKHTRLTAAISTIVGFLLAAGFVYLRAVWGAVLFGLSAVQSYRRFARGAVEANPGDQQGSPPQGIPPELAALLRAARHALGEEELERASTLAQRVLEGDGGKFPVPPAARCEALEVIAWAHLLEGRPEVAAEVLVQARRFGAPDAALEGAVPFALKDYPQARSVLEAARAQGDDRKQIVGPLVQILIAQGEVGRAADLALAVVDTLSDDDTRHMASLAVEHGAFATAARLHEAIFNRHHLAEDAYEAARAEAQAGRPERALDLLRRAVAAGFSDRARVWSDSALATLQASPALEAVLPRP